MGIIIGVIGSFVLFFIYDVNDVSWKRRRLQCLFGAGGLLLACVTVLGLLGSGSFIMTGSPFFYAGILLALFFLILLIYTLFFALPWKDTYGDHVVKDRRMVCSWGMYALCRHPGVGWMAGMYAGLWLAIPCHFMGLLFCSTTICNVLYVCFQDIWTFPRLFDDYEQYKHSTPFLIPTQKSIRACIRDLKKGKAGA